jgi:hypothetical protein
LRNLKLPLVLCTIAAIAALALARQEPADGKGSRTAAPPAAERLVYKIQWDPPRYLFFLPKMEVGEVSVAWTANSEYNGRKAHKIVMTANSSGALVRLSGMKVEDEFVFYTEPETLCTIVSSEKIREGKRKRQIDVQYFRETRQLHIREVDEAVVPPKIKKDETKNNIPECVHDPLSALYMFRQLSLQNQFATTFVLANDDKIREVRSLVEKQEVIETSSGKTAAWRVSTFALMGGLFKEGGQFRIWLSADEKKVPLQFEVKVRLGCVLGKLTSIE